MHSNIALLVVLVVMDPPAWHLLGACRISGHTSDLLNQDLHFNKAPSTVCAQPDLRSTAVGLSVVSVVACQDGHHQLLPSCLPTHRKVDGFFRPFIWACPGVAWTTECGAVVVPVLRVTPKKPSSSPLSLRSQLS